MKTAAIQPVFPGVLSAAVLALTTFARAELASGVIAYWPLDQALGTRTPDVAGGHDLTLENLTAADFVAGKVGRAVRFDTARGTLMKRVHSLGDRLPINQHPAFTIAFWSQVAANGLVDQRLFAEASTLDNHPLFTIGTARLGDSGRIDLYFRQDPWPRVDHLTTHGAPLDGAWHHVALVQQEDGSRALFIDGVRDDAGIPAKPDGDWRLNTTSLGGIARADSSGWLTGLIDEVALWDRALNEAELGELVAEGLSAAFPSAAGDCEDCGTLVGGNIANANWTREGSPYCVTNDVYVAGLTIREGVEVRFCGNHVFEVAGRLRVVGSAEEPVRFHPADAAIGWQGILFRDAVPGSYFLHTIVEGAKHSGLRITNTPPALTNCWVINNTTDGEGGGIKAEIKNGADFVLDGCVISNNLAKSHGGGVRLGMQGGMFLAQGCVFAGNVGGGYGGGFMAHVDGPSTSLRFVDCYSTNNTTSSSGMAGAGGLGVSYYTNPNYDLEIHRLVVRGNLARSGGGNNWAQGGGIGIWGGRSVVRNCWIVDNSARQGVVVGGGVYFSDEAQAVVENCVIAGNQVAGSSTGAAGIEVRGSSMRMFNCTLTENGTENGAEALYSPNGTSHVTNSIIYLNGRSITTGNHFVGYSCVQGDFAGDGNIASNPGFCRQNFSLLQGSPCIDAGHPDLAHRDGCLDNTGDCTPFARGTTRNDMGAYGGPWVCGWTDASPQPKIRIQPGNAIALEGDAAAMGVIVTGDTPLTYQWYKGNAALTGATNAVLRWPSVALADASIEATVTNAYHVEVTNASGTRSSAPAWLMVAELEANATVEQGEIWLTIRRRKPITRCELRMSETAVGPWTAVAMLALDEEQTRWRVPGPGFYCAVPSP